MSNIRKPVTCADGFTFSVQASSYHYCSPRRDRGPFSEVEVGYPNRKEPLLMRWAEDEDKPTQTVYGWVPSQVIREIIAKHGGVVSGKLPPLK